MFIVKHEKKNEKNKNCISVSFRSGTFKRDKIYSFTHIKSIVDISIYRRQFQLSIYRIRYIDAACGVDISKQKTIVDISYVIYRSKFRRYIDNTYVYIF
jgi:hypothetical protein